MFDRLLEGVRPADVRPQSLAVYYRGSSPVETLFSFEIIVFILPNLHLNHSGWIFSAFSKEIKYQP